MRVLQITAFSGWGCTGRIALGIHDALVAQGCESVIAWGRKNTALDSVSTIQIGNFIDQQIHGIHTRITDKCGFGSEIVTKKFIKKIDEFMPDLIQLHIMHGYYINLEILFDYLKQREIPVVWTFHDCWAFTGHCPYFDFVGCEKWKAGCYDCQQKKHHPRSWLIDNSKWNWYKKRELFTGIKNLTIVTPSEWMAGLVRESFFSNCRLEVINNGIDLNAFKPIKGKIREKYGIIGKRIVLGVSSSWAKSKGLDDFCELADRLPIEFKIVLVGLSKKQKNMIPSSIVGIQHTDNVKELAELYSAADIFVNPTYEDNYPTTNLEALACGTPVITYDTGGSPEIVRKSGKGLVVQQNVDALYNAILEIENMLNNRGVIDKNLLDQRLRFNEYFELYRDIVGV